MDSSLLAAIRAGKSKQLEAVEPNSSLVVPQSSIEKSAPPPNDVDANPVPASTPTAVAAAAAAKKKKRKKKKKNKAKMDADLAADMFPSGMDAASKVNDDTHSKSGRAMDMSGDYDEEDLEVYHGNGQNPRLGFVYLMTALVALDYSLVLPRLMQNLEVQEPMPYVWLFVAHSVGQFVGAPLIARYLRGGRIVPAVVFGAFAIIVGNGLFWFFSINQYGWGMGGGRVVCGVGGAVATASYGHIVRHSNRSVRIGRIRAFRSVDVTMRILGLALGALFGVIFPDELFLGLKNSNAGALVTISAACVILSLSNVQNCCADPTEQRRGHGLMQRFERAVDVEACVEFDSEEQFRGEFSSRSNMSQCEWLSLLYMNFALSGVLCATVFYLCLTYYSTQGPFFAMAGVTLLVYVGYRMMPDMRAITTKRLMWGLIVSVIGCAVLRQHDGSEGDWVKYVGAMVLVCGFQVGSIEIVSMYTLVRSRRVSLLGAVTWFFSFSNLASVAGPLVAGAVMSTEGAGSNRNPFDDGALAPLANLCILWLLSALLVGFFAVEETHIDVRSGIPMQEKNHDMALQMNERTPLNAMDNL